MTSTISHCFPTACTRGNLRFVPDQLGYFIQALPTAAGSLDQREIGPRITFATRCGKFETPRRMW